MTENTPAPASAARVECPATKDPVIRMMIAGLGLLALGGWFAYDAFWAVDKQGQRKYSMEKEPTEFLFQAGMASLLPPAGIVLLVWSGRMRRRVLVADERGMGYLGRPAIGWERLKRLVPRGKGLLDVYYDDGRRLRLDSWKLLNFNELVAYIESLAPQVPVETKEP